MRKRAYKFLSMLLSVSMILSCFVMTEFVSAAGGPSISIREEVVDGDKDLYKLVVSLEGFENAKSVLVALAYDSQVVTPAKADGSDLTKPNAYMFEAIAEGTDEPATLAPVTSGTGSGGYTTFYTGIYVTTGTFTFDTQQDAFSIYYKVKDTSLMNKATWRFATVEEVADLYKDNTGASVKVTDDSSPVVKYSLQGTTQGNGLTGADMPVRFSM